MINNKNHKNSKEYSSFEKSTLIFEMLNRFNKIHKDYAYLFLDSNSLIKELDTLKNKIEDFTNAEKIEELTGFEIQDIFILLEQNLRILETMQPPNIISFNTQRQFSFEDYFPDSFLKFKNNLLNKEEFMSDEDYKDICMEDWGIVGGSLDIEILEKIDHFITETKTIISEVIKSPIKILKRKVKLNKEKSITILN